MKSLHKTKHACWAKAPFATSTHYLQCACHENTLHYPQCTRLHPLSCSAGVSGYKVCLNWQSDPWTRNTRAVLDSKRNTIRRRSDQTAEEERGLIPVQEWKIKRHNVTPEAAVLMMDWKRNPATINMDIWINIILAFNPRIVDYK